MFPEYSRGRAPSELSTKLGATMAVRCRPKEAFERTFSGLRSCFIQAEAESPQL